MKKIIFILILVFCFISCNDGKELVEKIKLSDLPEKLENINKTFMDNNSANYFDRAIKLTKGRKVYYLIDLYCGDFLIADEKGDWIAIYGSTKRYRGYDIPLSLIPEKVKTYMSDHRTSEVFWIQKRKKGGYNVFDGNMIMIFDKDYKVSILPREDFKYGEIDEWFKKELGFDPFVY